MIKEQIHTHVEEMKIARQMRIGEIVDDGDMDHECCHDDTSFPA